MKVQIKLQSPLCRQKQQRGFTLIELMVVLAIIAGMAALIVPNLNLTTKHIQALSKDYKLWLSAPLLVIRCRIGNKPSKSFLMTHGEDLINI